MQSSWLVLVPPLIVVIIASATQRIVFSLIMGIISASLVFNDFAVSDAFVYVIKRLWSILEISKLSSLEQLWTGSNLFICGFLLILGFIIAMIRNVGAVYAYGNFVAKRLKTARGVECSSLLLSALFFFDDYFSCLTVGSVMQPVTDKFRVPRVRLALLVSVITAPLALIVPLSSWVAEITGQFRNAGVTAINQANSIIIADPLYLYIMIIPYMFYALIVIASMMYIVLGRISFGIIATHEHLAQTQGNLVGGKVTVNAAEIDSVQTQQGSLYEFIFPILLLFISFFVWIACAGQWTFVGGSNSLLEAIQNANIFAGLFVSGFVAFTATFIMLLITGRVRLGILRVILSDGMSVMGGAILMLIFIWTLSSMLSKDLQTGDYLAQKLVGHIDIWLLPAVFFCLAALVASLIGTAWGTLGMLIPLALRMVPSFLGLPIPCLITQVPMLLPVLGAVISGSVVGNHISPIADMMVMAATSARAYHLDVVKVLISFAMPAVISSLISFLIVGKLIGCCSLYVAALCSLCAGIVCNVIIVTILQRMNKYHNC